MCFARIQCTCCLCLPWVYSMARFLHGSCQLFFTFPLVVWWWWSSGILWGRGTAQSLIAIHICKCWRHPISAVIVDVAIFLLRFDTCGLFLLRAFAFKALKPKVKPFLSTSIHATTLHAARSFAKQAFTCSKCATLHTASYHASNSGWGQKTSQVHLNTHPKADSKVPPWDCQHVPAFSSRAVNPNFSGERPWNFTTKWLMESKLRNTSKPSGWNYTQLEIPLKWWVPGSDKAFTHRRCCSHARPAAVNSKFPKSCCNNLSLGNVFLMPFWIHFAASWGNLYWLCSHCAIDSWQTKQRSTASRTTGIAPSSVTCSCKHSEDWSKPHTVQSTKEQLKFTSSQSARYMSTERLSPGVRLTIWAVGIWMAEVALCHCSSLRLKLSRPIWTFSNPALVSYVSLALDNHGDSYVIHWFMVRCFTKPGLWWKE